MHSAINDLWLLPPFLKALEKRGREASLIAGVADTVKRLQDPAHRAAGLNLEQLLDVDRTGKPVYSARINREARLVLVEMKRGSWGLLYFDNHDPAYRWVNRNAACVPEYISRAERFGPGRQLFGPVQGVRSDEDEPLRIRGEQDLREMLSHGFEHYLATLDPLQAHLATIDFHGRKGPTVIRGGAGTGKTALAVARVKHLASQPEMGFGRVLYLCFSRSLANAVQELLAWHFGGSLPAGEIEVATIHQWCGSYLDRRGIIADVNPAANYGQNLVAKAVAGLPAAERAALQGIGYDAIHAEIAQVLRPSVMGNEQEYLELDRAGRGLPLRRPQRQVIWRVFMAIESSRAERKLEFDELPPLTLHTLGGDPAFVPYRSVVLDEAQDCGRAVMRLARTLVGGDERRLFVLADPAQAIFPNGFRWAQRELMRTPNVHILKTCYRNTLEIHDAAAPLRTETGDDGVHRPERRGRRPEVAFHASREALLADLVGRVTADLSEWPPDAVAVLAPRRRALQEVRELLAGAGVETYLNPEGVRFSTRAPGVRLLTLHSAKGLDFPVVYIAPLSGRGLAWMDEEREQALLYVGMTRASQRLALLVLAPDPPRALGLLHRDAVSVGGPAADAATILTS